MGLYSYLDEIYSDVNPYFATSTKGALLLGIDAINNSVYNILTTPIGTRYRRPEYGSYLPFLLQELPSNQRAFEIRSYCISAIERWEPRIQLITEAINVQPLETEQGYSVKIPYYVPDINRRGEFAANFTIV